ncbi:flagellar basal body-associated FliL family protein [Acidihalobacter prosperus]
MADEQPQKGGSKLKMIIIIAVVVVLLLVAGIGATLFFTGAFSKKGGTGANAAHAVETKHPPIYFSIQPAMVVNFQNPTQARYLQVAIDVMARDPKVIEEVKTNMPAIRNRLIILLSAQHYDEISTPDGKQKLRKEVLDSINAVLKESGASGKIEQVYFTNFVMQ